jgi:hypothetical protein
MITTSGPNPFSTFTAIHGERFDQQLSPNTTKMKQKRNQLRRAWLSRQRRRQRRVHEPSFPGNSDLLAKRYAIISRRAKNSSAGVYVADDGDKKRHVKMKLDAARIKGDMSLRRLLSSPSTRHNHEKASINLSSIEKPSIMENEDQPVGLADEKSTDGNGDSGYSSS